MSLFVVSLSLSIEKLSRHFYLLVMIVMGRERGEWNLHADDNNKIMFAEKCFLFI